MPAIRLWLVWFGAAILLCGQSPALRSSDRTPIRLWTQAAPFARGDSSADIPTVTPFLVSATQASGSGFIVCPGGGYQFRSDHEGSRIALWLNHWGIQAFVLNYRVAPYRYPASVLDAERAVRLVRARAVEWGIASDHVGIIGFSAGGHLASTVETHFDLGNLDSRDPVDRVSDRPDLAILVYPLVTMGKFTHSGSKKNLLGVSPDPQLVQLLSNELHVSPQTPPTFLVQAADDTVVPVENSILFAAALRRAGVPFALHIFDHGGHGYGLADGVDGAPNLPQLGLWPTLAANWLKNRGWTRP